MKIKSPLFALLAAALLVGLIVGGQSDAQVKPGGGFVPPGKLGGGGGGAGTITGVTSGNGVTGGGTSGTVTIDVGAGAGILVDSDHVLIDQAYTQRRLSSSCSFGQFITGVAADGTVTCAADAGDITAVTTSGTSGLTGGVTTGAAALSLLTSCSDQQVLKWTASGSTWGCANDTDTNTTYSAGTSLALSGTTFSLNEPGASCSAGQYLSAMSATGTGTCTAEVGDIAGITTGSTSGLTGGCTSGTCTLSMLTSCSNNNVLKYDTGSSSWVCSAPTTGTVTSVATTSPMTGGTITGTGTIALNFSTGLTTSGGNLVADETELQHRVTGTCATGMVSTINSDGTVVCSTGVSTNALYGFGTDGALNFDGSTTVLGLAPSFSVYTLSRDIFATTITIAGGVTVKSNGYRIFASTSIAFSSSSSKIANSGANGAAAGGGGGGGTGNGGVGAAASGSIGDVSNTMDGGVGGNATATGAGGFNAANDPQSFTGVGGAGGHGGSSTAGGAAGTATNSGANGGGWSFSELLDFRLLDLPASTGRFSCGTGGGGGGGGTSGGAGGAGGGGGGCLFVASPSITGTGAIEAKGGNGFAGSNGTNGGGGGGGGGGGLALIITSAGTPTYTVSVAGGSAGAAGTGGTATAGAAGGAGAAITMIPGAGAGTSGFMTSITAGTGLSGGTITSSGTIAVNLTTTSCAAGKAETATASDGTSTCSTFVDTAGTSLSLSGHTLNVALPGGTCSTGQVVTAIAADGTATCGNPIPNDYLGKHLEYVDDWLFQSCNAAAASSTTCGSIYTSVITGAGTQVSSTGTTTRPGVIQLTTGSTTTGRMILETSNSAFDFGQGNYTFEWVGGFETLSTSADEFSAFIGFGDTNTNMTNGCGFLYDRGNVATSGANSGNASNWECYCANGSARTVYLMAGVGNSDESFALGTAAVGALALPSTNIDHLKLVTTGTTRAEFYTCAGSSCTKKCDINTNVPSGGATHLMGLHFGMLKSAGTNPRTMDVDYTRLGIDLTSARSP